MCVSCTTFHYYYPSHEFKEKEYKPVKKGLVKLNIHKKVTSFERPGDITSRQAAHDKGLSDVKKSIAKFCEGKFFIKKMVEKKEIDVGSSVIWSNTFGGYNAFNTIGPWNQNAYTYSTFQSVPVFIPRRYTSITFQCKR